MSKYNGWKNLPTIQFKEIISELEAAKDEQKNVMLIADTGLGKTNTIELFKTKRNRHTYVVTLGDTYNLMALLIDVQEMLGVKISRGKNEKHGAFKKIAERLKEFADAGDKPVIILDEAENAKMPTLKAIKQLYDAIKGKCGIVLIGTEQLIFNLNKKSNGQSIPQLRRRFKAGTRFISSFNKQKDMRPFFNEFIPDQPDLQDLLIELCDNYGELNDYLDPFLRYCDRTGKPVSADLFRAYHKIPNRK